MKDQVYSKLIMAGDFLPIFKIYLCRNRKKGRAETFSLVGRTERFNRLLVFCLPLGELRCIVRSPRADNQDFRWFIGQDGCSSIVL